MRRFLAPKTVSNLQGMRFCRLVTQPSLLKKPPRGESEPACGDAHRVVGTIIVNKKLFSVCMECFFCRLAAQGTFPEGRLAVKE